MCKVILVDDDKSLIERTTRLLESEFPQIEVRSTIDHEELLQLAQEDDVIVFFDLQLSDVNILKTALALKAEVKKRGESAAHCVFMAELDPIDTERANLMDCKFLEKSSNISSNAAMIRDAVAARMGGDGELV